MDFGKEVEGALREGRRIQEALQEVTLKALTRRELDLATLRSVTRDALDAVRETAQARGAGAQEAVKQAVAGVDQALAQAAQALKLSLEEAGGRAEKFSREDLAKARADLAGVEKMFVDALGETARAAHGTAKAAFEDLARHAETSGTAIGKQMREAGTASAQAAELARAQFKAGMEAAAASGAIFARAAAGVLAGIAEAIDPKHRKP